MHFFPLPLSRSGKFLYKKIFLLPGKYLLGKKTLYPIILWKIYILIDLSRQKKSNDKIFILNKLSNQSIVD